MGAEERFYTQHYGGGVLPLATPLAEFSAGMIGPGKRYDLAWRRILADSKAGPVLVEIGAGGGEFLRLLQLKKNFSCIRAFDIATRDHGQQIDAPATSGAAAIVFENSNLSEDWPIEDSSVDFLVAMMVIEHLFDPFHSFGEIKRVLRPDGTAFVNLPLVTSVWNRLRLLVGKVPVTSSSYGEWFEKRSWDGGHLHYFSIPAIRELAACSGLEVLDMAAVGRGHRVKSIFPTLLASEITFAVRRRA